MEVNMRLLSQNDTLEVSGGAEFYDIVNNQLFLCLMAYPMSVAVGGAIAMSGSGLTGAFTIANTTYELSSMASALGGLVAAGGIVGTTYYILSCHFEHYNRPFVQN